MTQKTSNQIPACAMKMLNRQQWFTDPGIVSRARMREASWLARLISSRRFAKAETAAITLGHMIHIRRMDEFDPHTVGGLALLAHEIKHVEQYEREGLLRFCIKYLWGYRLHGYSEALSFEAEAYAFERQVREHLKEEFENNSGRTPCCQMAEPHDPNNDFVKSVPAEFQFPDQSVKP